MIPHDSSDFSIVAISGHFKCCNVVHGDAGCRMRCGTPVVPRKEVMPSLKFTARGIAALKAPESGRVEYFNEGMPGFGIRISSSGIKTWVVLYRHKGRKRRHTLGTYPAMTLADAYEKARQTLNQAANGTDPAGDKRAERIADTFGELAEDYMRLHAMRKKKHWQPDDQKLKYDLLPKWKNIKAKEITRRDVIEVLDGIVDRGAPIQANRVLALIRKIFNFGISRDIVQHNPCQAVSRPSKPQSRDRVLSAQEIRKVWISAGQEDALISGILKLRLLTAQRGGEIEAMAWENIDFEKAVWTIPANIAKNGLAHRVPLSMQAIEILSSLATYRRNSKWVFPSLCKKDAHIENIQKAIQRVRSREGLTVDFVGHDLRRTAASHMASIGVPRLVISKVLNHVETGITAVYDRHSYDAEKRDALSSWAMYLMNILEGREEPRVVPLTRSASLLASEVVSG